MVSRLDGDRLVTVFGGSGFLGRHTVRALARRGWRVRAAVRRPDLAGHLQPLGAVGQIHPVQANVRYEESVARAIEGADAVVNLVGVLASGGRQTFDAVHVEGARAIAAAARRAGVDTLVHISAIGADPKANAQYARSKGAGEVAVREEFAGTIILRPSIVFGPEDEFFNRFARLAQLSPVVPLIGGSARFQPVYVGDVATAIAEALEGNADKATTYELGGPDVLTFRELLEKTLEFSEHKRPLFPIPFWLAKLQALLTWPLPNALRPITVDQVRMLQKDTIVSEEAVSEGRTLANLGVHHPHSVDAIVPTYLERFRPRGQYSHYRG